MTRSGGLGVMRQFIGWIRDAITVADLLFSLAPSGCGGRRGGGRGSSWS